MKYNPYVSIFACLIAASLSPALAHETPAEPVKPATPTYTLPPGVTEEMLAPPPVPRFMLEKPGTPLSTEEMLQQAREAEKNARPSKPESAGK